MTKRVIEIAEREARLRLENRLLVIRVADGGEHRVPIGEIECLILGTPAVSVTGMLLAALAGVVLTQKSIGFFRKVGSKSRAVTTPPDKYEHGKSGRVRSFPIC